MTKEELKQELKDRVDFYEVFVGEQGLIRKGQLYKAKVEILSEIILLIDL